MSGEERFKENIICAADWFTVIKPLLEDGNLLRISPSGLSMYPFLVGGRDEVFLRSTTVKKPVKGDIALFRREDGIHVLHRIHHIRNNWYYMLGDAQTGIEGPIDEKNVIAVVKAVIWKNRIIDRDNIILKTLTRIWTIMRPFRPIILKILFKPN